MDETSAPYPDEGVPWTAEDEKLFSEMVKELNLVTKEMEEEAPKSDKA